MAFFKSIAGSVLGSLLPRQGPGSKGESFSFDLPAQVDIAFNHGDDAEEPIALLWEACMNASQHTNVESTRQLLIRSFLDKFVTAYMSWTPDDAAFEAEAKEAIVAGQNSVAQDALQAGGASLGEGHEPLAIVLGCRGGHPRALIDLVVEGLEQLPNDLAQAVRRESGGLPALQSSGGISCLAACIILLRSHHNRCNFDKRGGLGALAKIVKVCLMRLNTLAAIMLVEDKAKQGVGQSSFLQSLLAYCVKAFDTYALKELEYFGWEGATDSEHVEGSSAGAVHALVCEGVVALYVDLLRSMKTLRLRGGATLARLEDIVLRSLLTVVAASSQAQGSLASAGGIQFLVDCLGFPVAAAPLSAKGPSPGMGLGPLHKSASRSLSDSALPHILRGPGLRDAEEEMRVQMLSLQILVQCTTSSRSQLSKMKEGGGFQRLTQLLQWATLTFAYTDGLTASSSTASIMPTSHNSTYASQSFNSASDATHASSPAATAGEAGAGAPWGSGAGDGDQDLDEASDFFKAAQAAIVKKDAAQRHRRTVSSDTADSARPPGTAARTTKPPRNRAGPSQIASSMSHKRSESLPVHNMPSSQLLAISQGSGRRVSLGEEDGGLTVFEVSDAKYAVFPDGGALHHNFIPEPPRGPRQRPSALSDLKGMKSLMKIAGAASFSEAFRKMTGRAPVSVSNPVAPAQQPPEAAPSDLQLLTAAERPICPELEELFVVLCTWIDPNAGPPPDAAQCERLLRCLMKAVTDAFHPAISFSPLLDSATDVAKQTEAINLLCHKTCILQHYVLGFLGYLLNTQPVSVLTFKALGFWNLLFGPSFFYFAYNDPSDASLERSLKVAQSGGTLTWRRSTSRSVIAQDVHNLRKRIMQLAQQAAGLPGLGDDAGKMIDLLSQHALDHDIVLLVAPSLAHLLHTMPNMALPLYEAHDLLSVLAQVITLQQGAELPSTTTSARQTRTTSASIVMGPVAGSEASVPEFQLQQRADIDTDLETLSANSVAAQEGMQQDEQPSSDEVFGLDQQKAVAMTAESFAGMERDALHGRPLVAVADGQTDSGSRSVVAVADGRTDSGPSSEATLASWMVKGRHDSSQDCQVSDSVVWEARFAVLALLSTYLDIAEDVRRLALLRPQVARTLTAVLWDGEIRMAALDMFCRLMCTNARTEDEALAKSAMFQRYVEALPRAVNKGGEEGLQLVKALLCGMRTVLDWDARGHQLLFREAGCFVQIINLLNREYPVSVSLSLCGEVLRTLRALLLHNVENQAAFRELVGYDTLQHILLERCGAPPLALLNWVAALLVAGPMADNDLCNSRRPLEVDCGDALPLLFALARPADRKAQLWVLNTLKQMLQNSIANMYLLDKAGINRLAIEWFSASKGDIELQQHIAMLMQVTASYNIAGRDLRECLRLMQRNRRGEVPEHASWLLRMLLTVAQAEGPPNFFHLKPHAGGIKRTAALSTRSMASQGFTFVTWLRLEVLDVSLTSPPLRNLLTLLFRGHEDIKGIILAMKGSQMVVYDVLSQGKYCDAVLDCPIPYHQWQHIAVSHSAGMSYNNPHVNLFVNGILVASAKLSRYPRLTDALNTVTIGTALPTDATGLEVPLGSLHAQLGPLYLFDDVLTAQQVLAFSDLGPNYHLMLRPVDLPKQSFLRASSSSMSGHDFLDDKRGMRSKLAMSYSPQAAAGLVLYDLASTASGTHTSETAVLLDGTLLCIRRHLGDMLACLGGVAVLLPLIDLATHDKRDRAQGFSNTDTVQASDVVGLIAAVLQRRPSTWRDIRQVHGFAILSHLLSLQSPEHLSIMLRTCCKQLLSSLHPDDPNALDLLRYLVLNTELWAAAAPAVQHHVHASYLPLQQSHAELYRRLLGPTKVFDTIRWHYWETTYPDASWRTAGDVSPASPVTGSELSELRKGLLAVVRLDHNATNNSSASISSPAIQQAGEARRPSSTTSANVPSSAQQAPASPRTGDSKAITSPLMQDVTALLGFLHDCPDGGMLEDMLTFLCDVCQATSHSSMTVVPCVQELGGVYLFIPLLQHSRSRVRILALQLIHLFGIPLSPSAPGPVLPGVPRPEPGHPCSQNAVGVWVAVCQSVSRLTLNASLRKALVPWLEGPLQCQGFTMLLNLAMHCKDPYQRLAVLEAVCAAVGCPAAAPEVDDEYSGLHGHGPIMALGLLVEHPGWQNSLLQMLTDDSPSVRAAQQQRSMGQVLLSSGGRHDPAAWQWKGPEMQLLQQLLTTLLAYCMGQVHHGWHHVQYTLAVIKQLGEQGKLDGWTLAHEVLTNVIDSVLPEHTPHTGASTPRSPQSPSSRNQDSVPSTAAAALRLEANPNVLHDNLTGLLGLVDDLSAGVILPPRGPLPPPEALAWAKSTNSSVDAPAERLKEESFTGQTVSTSNRVFSSIPDTAWESMRLAPSGTFPGELTASCWRLYSSALQLLIHLYVEGSSGIRTPGNPLSSLTSLTEFGAALFPGAAPLLDSALSTFMSRNLDESRPDTPLQPAVRRGTVFIAGGLPGDPAAFGSARRYPNDSSMRVDVAQRQALVHSVMTAPMPGCSEAVVQHGLQQRGFRLAVRLLLLYLQGQPPDGESQDAIAMVLQAIKLQLTEVRAGPHVQLLLSLLHRVRETALGHSMLNEMVGKLGPWLSGDSSPHTRIRLVDGVIMGFADVAHMLFSDPHAEPSVLSVEDVLQWMSAHEAEAALKQELMFLGHVQHCHKTLCRLLQGEGEARLALEHQSADKAMHTARELLGSISNTDRVRRAAARQLLEDEAQEVGRKWIQLQRQLKCEWSLWAPPGSEAIIKRYKLDSREDSIRRRMRLKRNHNFVQYDSDLPNGKRPAAKPRSGAAAAAASTEEIDDIIKAFPGQGDDIGALIDEHDDSQDNEEVANGLQGELQGESEQEEAVGATPQEDGDWAMDESLLHSDDAAETRFACPCQLVNIKGILVGRLELTSQLLHFTSGTNAPAAVSDVASDSSTDVKTDKGKAVTHSPRKHKRWSLSRITEAHHTLHVLQHIAMELFFNDGTSALLVLPSQQAVAQLSQELHSVARHVIIMDRKRKGETVMRLQTAWQRWEISNFDYLMQLNTLAGRTYCNLNAYPVFPWVLQDYRSEAVDLTNPASYRDLSKPIGAQDPKRLSFFIERFNGMKGDPTMPPFHYGSHYSSAGIVLFYMMRMEPFTGLYRSLQGGRFDVADRLFHNMMAAWDNVLENTSDVKELIPEFYYQPEFLRNSNDFSFGVRQDGAPIGDVVLPHWAKGSPEEFIRVQREALESEHVSANIHQWIDLIFGSKQRGPEAEEACNIFFYLTYEGAVDLDGIPDPQQRRAVEAQICHFGQTPSQLFRRPHPPRGPPPSPLTFPLFNAPDALKRMAVVLPVHQRANVPIVALQFTGSHVVAVSADRQVTTYKWQSTDATSFTFSTLLTEAPYTLEHSGQPNRMLGHCGGFDSVPESHWCVLTPGGQYLLSVGYWDNSIKCHNVDDGMLLQSVVLHQDLVTCVAVASDSSVIVTGSRDTTVMVLDTRLGPSGPPVGPRGSRTRPQAPLREQPRHQLVGHTEAVTAVAVSRGLDLVASGDSRGMVLLHSLVKGTVTFSVDLPGSLPCPVNDMQLSEVMGCIVVHRRGDLGLTLLSVNGRVLQFVEAAEKLEAMLISNDSRFLLTGGSQGQVTLRWLHSLEVVLRYEAGSSHIISLAMSPEECFLAGLANGAITLFAPDPRRKITARLRIAA